VAVEEEEDEAAVWNETSGDESSEPDVVAFKRFLRQTSRTVSSTLPSAFLRCGAAFNVGELVTVSRCAEAGLSAE